MAAKIWKRKPKMWKATRWHITYEAGSVEREMFIKKDASIRTELSQTDFVFSRREKY